MIYLNGSMVVFEKFPNNEMFFDMVYNQGKEQFKIIFKFKDNSTLMELFMLVKEIRRLYPEAIIELVIAYMPYSRMDRSEENRVFSLKHIADFINDLNFHSVRILQPHSDVTCALINRSVKVDVTEWLFDYALRVYDFDWQYTDAIMFPDAGAQNSMKNMCRENIILGSKRRDFSTGRITDYNMNIPEGYDVKGKHIVIVDDLCSKGGTFIWAASILRAYEPRKISLIVTHMEETVYKGDLLESPLIDYILTTDTIIEKDKHIPSKMQVLDFTNFTEKRRM